MHSVQNHIVRNGLLATLSREDFAAISPCLELVTLSKAQVLFEPFQPIEFVYFFEEGLSSEIASAAASSIEVGCIGREGLSGVPALLGAGTTPHKSFMQVGGRALRIRSGELRDVMNASQQLRALLLRYTHVFMIQLASTALANGRYKVEQRLARWLLMCHDRLDSDLPLLHEFLALMLGVRRPSVTEALHVLEGNGLIKAGRGLITVTNRAELEVFAGHSYGVPENEYRRLIAEAK